MSGCPGAGRRGAAGLPPPPQRGARLGSGQRSGVSGSAPSSRAPPDAQPHSRALRLHARGPRSRPPLCLVWSGRQRERVLGGVCLGVQSREAAGGQGRGPREGGWRHRTPRFLQLTEIRAGGRQGRTRRGGGAEQGARELRRALSAQGHHRRCSRGPRSAEVPPGSLQRGSARVKGCSPTRPR